MLRHVVRLAAAALVAAAAVVVAPSAQAATCGTSSGVSVVVDFHQLGGLQTACDAGGAGSYAAAQFTDVGHTLTYVQNEPFVCQVDGAPSTQCVRTPPANAYWSLWWSDGTSGTWNYASVGVGALKVPAGGYVALSWQKGTAQVKPGVAPTSHTPSSPTSHPTSAPPRPPSSAPTSKPTAKPTSSATSSAPATTSTGAPSPSGSTASKHPSRPHSDASPTPSATATHSDAPLPTSESAQPPSTSAPSSDSGLPGWVAPLLVAALFVAAGAVAVVRRKRAGGS